MNGSSYWMEPIQVGRWIFNTLYHQALAVITIYAIWIPMQHYSTPFSWHVILCTLGLFPLMAEALILFGSDNVWSQGIERKNKIILHIVLMTLSAGLIIAGIAIETDRKKKNSLSNFTTAHGITGLICMIFLIISLIEGTCAFFSKALSGYVRPVIIKFIHNMLGQSTFIMGIVSLCLGYYTDWFIYWTTSESRLVATIVTAILCLWSIIYAFREEVRQGQTIRNVPTYRGVPIDAISSRPGFSRPVSVIERYSGKLT